MGESNSADTILKILSGVQAGVDVALLPGEYTLGSGDDDDIQIFDVSLKLGHARLLIGSHGIEIAGASGQLRTKSGVLLDAGGSPQAIEPLDIVSAGTTRFALGPRSANWASITEDDGDAAGFAGERGQQTPQEGFVADLRKRAWPIGIATIVILLVLAAGIPLLRQGKLPAFATDGTAKNPFEEIRAAVSSLDFHDRLTVRQEIDGAIYVTGYVEKPVERRAVLAVVRKTDIPARVRISVLSQIRNEVANLLKAEEAPLSFTLSDQGNLTLTGVILDAKRATHLAELISQRVNGLSGITSLIRTGPSLLDDVISLAEKSKLRPWVQLRLDKDLIEASGIIPRQKIDAWAGFLQAYSSEFSDLIPLRSFVQLDDGSNAAPPPQGGPALFLGNVEPKDGDRQLDVSKLRNGSFSLEDVFLAAPKEKHDAAKSAEDGTDGGKESVKTDASEKNLDLASILHLDDPDTPKASARPADMLSAAPGGTRPIINRSDGPSSRAKERQAPQDTGRRLTDNASQTTRGRLIVNRRGVDEPAGQPGAPSPAKGRLDAAGPAVDHADAGMPPDPLPMGANPGGGPSNALNKMARRLIELSRNGELVKDKDGALLKKSVEALKHYRSHSGVPAKDAGIEQYAPLLPRPQDAPDGRLCWTGSHLSAESVVAALFWLDLLSVDAQLSLADFPHSSQLELLDAALNPTWSRRCAVSLAASSIRSVYVTEVSRNKNFVRFVTRDLGTSPVDVVGAAVVGERYILTRTGRKMKEGAAPDEASRLLIVGELGAAFENSRGYSTRIFGADMNWLVR